MDLKGFSEASKTHYIVVPPPPNNTDDINVVNHQSLNNSIPFVPLLNGKESIDALTKRWELYNALNCQFHSKIDNLLTQTNQIVYEKIYKILSSKNTTTSKGIFTSLFLLGSDSNLNIPSPADTENKINVIVSLTPKESPNVRMMIKRSMFELLAIASERIDPMTYNVSENLKEITLLGVEYDLSLLKNFKNILKKDLKLIYNFKEADSFSFQVMDDFLQILKTMTTYDGIEVGAIFHVSTNLTNIEKNLRQKSIRLIKKNMHCVDLSKNKNFELTNKIFETFLITVDGKLHLSSSLLSFTLDKMANCDSKNKLVDTLIKILDYSLMFYFFNTSFSIFVDIPNLVFFNENYVKELVKCKTFQKFIEKLVETHEPSENILDLLENKHNALEDFFAKLLISQNPRTEYLFKVKNILETELHITNYNLIEIYYNLLLQNNKGENKILDYLVHNWPECANFEEKLAFPNVEIICQELFMLDNKSDLLSENLFPKMRSNIEDDLLSCDRLIPSIKVLGLDTNDENLFSLSHVMDPPSTYFFSLYREASAFFNIYDFYVAFKTCLPKDVILKYIMSHINNYKDNEDYNDATYLQVDILKNFLEENNNDKELFFDKLALIWFIQCVTEFKYMGIIKDEANTRKSLSGILEKQIWRGI
ncbi:related to Origin recognition complex subunit 3 [Saccharomycodes ludwigii]|uniref:Related to Origin recognition complex subunit 3 n=1 Tax=Saccharomycodes ludwigii TaxID=36035 RepID=A0A376B6R6_9ASCO|nr:related to Origin recognition complex subunit 3 [Saccharomycodes ludwigii]